MDPSDVTVLKTAAGDALTYLNASLEHTGDDDLHCRFFKTTESEPSKKVYTKAGTRLAL